MSKRFCGPACRGRAFREREREAQIQQGTAEEASASMRARRRGRKTSPAPARAPGTDPAQTFERVAMQQQIQRQAPPGAVGYRVVLSLRPRDDLPHVLPLSGAPGSPTAWRLAPFEPPDDLRLQDGCLYRLLFVDAQGVVLPNALPYVAALRFFLGPPESGAAREAAGYAAVLSHIQEPAVRDTYAQQFARQQIAEKKAQLAEQEQKRAHESIRELERQTAAVEQRTAAMQESRRKQAAEEAEQARAQAHAAAHERQPWLIALLVGGVPALFSLGAWLWPLIKERTAEMTEEQRAEAWQRFQEGTERIARRLSPTAPAGSARSNPPQESGRPETQPTRPASSAAVAPPPPSAAPERTAAATVAAPPEPAHAVATEPARAPATPAGPSVEPVTAADEGERPSASPNDTPPPSAEASTLFAQEAADPTLTAEELRCLAELTCDRERRAHFTYEVVRLACEHRNEPAPPAPCTSLSEPQRKELEQLVLDPRKQIACIGLRDKLDALLQQSPESVMRLPAPFRSLSEEEAARVRNSLRSAEHGRYFGYCGLHLGARLSGTPLPQEPTTTLPAEERRQLRRLTRDLRTFHYGHHVARQRIPARPTG